MLNRVLATILVALALAAAATSAKATVIWNQSVSGALSENPASPTPFTLSAGTNSIIATVGGANTGESGADQNWVNINITAGLQLSQFVLASYVSTDPQGFIGVQAGTSFAGGESAVNSEAAYLGYTHFGTAATNGLLPPANLVGDDLLPLMANPALAAGSAGFTPPLGAGSYTFLIQQLNAATNYQLDFDVSSVPEPATFGLLALTPLLALRRRRIFETNHSPNGGTRNEL
jgi:hypothetical protein